MAPCVALDSITPPGEKGPLELGADRPWTTVDLVDNTRLSSLTSSRLSVRFILDCQFVTECRASFAENHPARGLMIVALFHRQPTGHLPQLPASDIQASRLDHAGPEARTSATQGSSSATRVNFHHHIVGSTRHGSSSHIKPLPLLDTFQCNSKCQRLEYKPKTESHDFDLLFPPPLPHTFVMAPREKANKWTEYCPPSELTAK